MGDVEESEFLQFISCITQHLLKNGIGRNKPAIQVRKGNADGRVLKNRSPAFFTSHDLRMRHSQIVFTSFALRNIANVFR